MINAKKFLSRLKNFDKRGLLKITYFALTVFVLETVFFHTFNYIHSYFDAVLIISYAVLGIGLGAFISGKIKIKEEKLFVLCSLGMVVSLYIAAIKTVFFASVGISNFVLSLVFLFPAIYISRIYADQKSNRVYLFDMAGCFLGVVLAASLYKFLFSETIFFLFLAIIPLVALIGELRRNRYCERLNGARQSRGFREKKEFIYYLLWLFRGLRLINVFSRERKRKKLLILVLSAFFILGSVLLYGQIVSDKYNLFGLINCDGVEEAPEKITKIFCRNVKKVKSYDNLVGRIDVIKYSDYKGFYHVVFYDGWANDGFNKRAVSGANDYLKYKYKGKKWPTLDWRFLYGNVKEPKVLIIGSSADGIVKSAKKITPVENITPIEINPAIIKIMEKDFYEEAGRAYLGLDAICGNGISFAKSTDKKFDMITLMNTHSVRNLGHQGAPDYLHTVETYNLLLDRLTKKGYLMFEERPESPGARLALYRQINTLWHSLKERGAKNPSDHFIIWTWMGGEIPHKKYTLNYYTSILVTKNPIDVGSMEPWVNKSSDKKRKKRINFEYFKNYGAIEEENEFAELFKMIEAGNSNRLKKENFDSSAATNDRPFVSQGTLSNKKLNGIVSSIGILTLALWLIFTAPLIKSKKRKIALPLNLYFVLIGFAFFFIEIILFQVYQNVFLSPSFSFIAVLGVLLLSSGIGGYFSGRFNIKKTILFLVPVCLIAVFLPNWLLKLGAPSALTEILGIIFISTAGFFMGMYFPKGLSFAKKSGLKKEVYYFFAINAVAGCFAVPAALYVGVKIGYSFAIIIALAFYLVAGLILGRKNKT